MIINLQILGGVYTSDKYLNLSTTNKLHLNCDNIDGSVVNGLRQPILYSFVLDILPGYKLFCEPETKLFKKLNKSNLNTITFYLEDDNDKEVDFNQETLIFTLQLIKIYITCLHIIIGVFCICVYIHLYE